jgi:hypothetical protein
MSKKNRDTYLKSEIKDTYNLIKLKINKKINYFKKPIINETIIKPESPFGTAKDAPMHIAFVIDGIVEDIIHCNERLGSLLLSDPEIIEFDFSQNVKINSIYDNTTGIFNEPNE